MIWVFNPGRGKEFSVLQNVQTCCIVSPNFLFTGHWGLVRHRIKSWGVRMASDLNLIQSLHIPSWQVQGEVDAFLTFIIFVCLTYVSSVYFCSYLWFKVHIVICGSLCIPDRGIQKYALVNTSHVSLKLSTIAGIGFHYSWVELCYKNCGGTEGSCLHEVW